MYFGTFEYFCSIILYSLKRDVSFLIMYLIDLAFFVKYNILFIIQDLK